MKPQHLPRSLAGVLPLLVLLLAAPNAARSQAAAPDPGVLAPGAPERLAQAAGDSRVAPWQRDRARRLARIGTIPMPGASAADLRSPQPAHVADAADGSQVNPNMWVTNGSVDAIATSGNTIYIGGSFTRVGPNTGSFVGIDAGSGAPVANWPRVTGEVLCSAPDGASGWYIGGTFTSVAGVARGNLAHIRADMTLDAWNFGIEDVPV